MKCTRRTLLCASIGAILTPVASQEEPPFAPSQSLAALEQFVLRRNQLIQSLNSRQLVEVMLEFYVRSRAIGLSQELQSDMLLFQWGAYDWGQGRNFEFDMTRQFIRRVEDTSLISQLSLKASYPPAAHLTTMEQGNRWCKSPKEVPEFGEFIRSSAAYRAVAFMRPKSVAATWSPV
jgi:hypothetical protein